MSPRLRWLLSLRNSSRSLSRIILSSSEDAFICVRFRKVNIPSFCLFYVFLYIISTNNMVFETKYTTSDAFGLCALLIRFYCLYTINHWTQILQLLSFSILLLYIRSVPLYCVINVFSAFKSIDIFAYAHVHIYIS